ncbi:WGR domain-containing protein [Rhizobium viscosum]
MARFYCRSLEPTLLGGSALVRRWSRIGTTGRQKIELFDTAIEAVDVSPTASCAAVMSATSPQAKRKGSSRRKARRLRQQAPWIRQGLRNRARPAVAGCALPCVECVILVYTKPYIHP